MIPLMAMRHSIGRKDNGRGKFSSALHRLQPLSTGVAERGGWKAHRVMLKMARKTELYDLPNEVLLRILNDLDNSDLYSVSFHSPRLHSLAIFVYLSANGIPNNEISAISEERGLQLIDSIQREAIPGIILLAFSE